MDRELYLMKYDFFLAEQMLEQDEMNRYIKECILAESGCAIAPTMNILNEGAVDKIKDAYGKIVSAIAKMWNKFLEVMTNLLNTDRGYLEKYKNIILKKRMVDAEYTMYNYQKGLPILVTATVPAFNYDSMKDCLSSEESFIAKEFPEFNNPKVQFVDNVKSIFRNGKGGGSDKITVKSSEINMTSVYDYCYNYKELAKKIQKDIDNVKNAVVSAVKIVDDLSKKQQQDQQQNTQQQSNTQTQQNTQQQTNTQTQQQNTQQQSNTQTQQQKPQGESYYSTVHKTFVHEIERSVDGQQQGNSSAPSPSNTNPAKAVQNINGDAAKSDDTRNAVDGADPKVVGEHINNYMKVCGDFLGAKLSIAQEAYKEYMQLIRMHVQDNVGNKDSVDKPTEKGEDYNNPQNNNGSNGNNNNNDNSNKKDGVLKGLLNHFKKI